MVYKKIWMPVTGDARVLTRVGACGICWSDLYIVDLDLKDIKKAFDAVKAGR